MSNMCAEAIRKDFVEKFSQWSMSRGKLEEKQSGELVYQGFSKDGVLIATIPIKLTDEQWVEYYHRASEDDDYPLSLMVIHLGEVITKAFNNNLQDASIIYDGCFDAIGRIPYTPPQT